MKKRFIVPAAIAATASAVSSMPLQVLALKDSVDGVEIQQGVQFVMRDEQNQLLENVHIEVYKVDSVTPSENGSYDLTSLTPVKTCVTQKDASIALGLMAGKYVAKITPPDNQVISDYCSNKCNNANEVIFEVPEVTDDEPFAFETVLLYFMNTDVSITDTLNLTVYDSNLNPVSGAVFNVMREALDGTLYDLGEYKSDVNGKISCPADDTDELPAGSRYIFTIKSCPENYKPEDGDTIYLQAIEGYNNRNFYLIEAESDAELTGTVQISIENENVSNLPFKILDTESNIVASGTLTSNIGEDIKDLPYGSYKLIIENVPNQYVSENGCYERAFELNNDILSLSVLFEESVPVVGDCSIELEVTDADTHAQIKNLVVKVLNSDNQVVQEVDMDKDGIAVFEGLSEGTYHFELVNNENYYILENQTVTVGKNNKVAWHEVQARKITYSAVLTTQCSNPDVVKNLKLLLHKNGKLVGKYTMTNGKITISNLELGDYEIFIEDTLTGYQLSSDTTFSITSENRVVNKTLVFEAQFATVVANVTNTSNNTPMKNVTINALDSLGNVVETGKTDKNGNISFTLPFGTYVLFAETPNSCLDMAAQNVTLNNADETTNISFETEFLSAGLNVVVADDNGLAVSDATVEIIDSNGEVVHTQEIKIDNYIISLKDLPLGKYTIHVSSCDENSYIKPADMELSLTEQKTYQAYLTFDTVKQEATTGDVLINLKDENGNPVELSGDVLIAISDENGIMVAGEYANANGQVSFLELEAGKYTATVFYADAPWMASEKSDVQFEVVSGDTANVEMTLFESVGSAVINVKDAVTDEMIAGVTLDIYSNDVLVGTYTTNENGQIEISKLHVGTYSYVVTSVPDGYEQTSASNFEISVDETTTIDIILVAQTGQAVLNIFDEKNELLYKTVVISLTDEDGRAYDYTTSDGVISTGWIKAGTYTVSVKNSVDGYSLKYAEAVVVVADTTQSYDIVFEKDTGSASIQVTTQNLNQNINVPNVNVEIFNEYNESIGKYTTDKDGNINVAHLPIGKYSVNVIEKSLPDGYLPLAGASFEITKNCNEDVTVLVLREVGTVQIQVLKNDNTAATQIAVSIKDKNGKTVATAETDGNGYATFGKIPTGDYDVKFDIPDGYSLSSDTKISVVTNEATTKTYLLNRHTGSLKIDCNVDEANIAFEIYDGDQMVESGVTDDNGEAIIEKLPAGKYVVKFIGVPSKYKDLEDANISIKKDVETILDVELKIKGATLNVKYLYENNNYPVENVQFEISTLNGKKIGTYTTNAAGNTSIDLPKGYYAVKTLSLPAGYIIPDNQIVEIKEDVNQSITFKLMQSTAIGTLALIIQDVDSNALEDVSVQLYGKNGSLYKTFTSDSNGQVYDEEVAADQYSVIISKAGYADVILENVVIEDGEMFFETIKMETTKEDVGTLTVNILDKDTGIVLSGVSVSLRDTDDNIVATATSDKNGEVVFEKLSYGNYKLYAEADEYVASGSISTIVNAETQNATIRLSKSTTGKLYVNVLDEENKPISEAVVSVTNGNDTFTAKTNSNGVAEIESIEAGNYEVAVSADGYNNYSATTTVVANKDNTTTAVLQELKLGNIKFVITDENDIALADVQVTLSNGSKYTTDANGEISISNQDVGTYVAEISKDGYISKTVSFDVVKNTTTKVEVALETIVTTGAVEFYIKDNNGNVLKDAVVSIVGKEVKTDENGYVKVSDLEEGTYDVHISKDGYRAKSATLSVTAKTTTTANVTLRKEVTTGIVNVYVTDENGNIVVGAKVVVDDGENSYTQYSNDEGMVVFDNVKPSDYTVIVSKDGYLNSSASVSVAVDTTYNINTTLKEKSTKGNLEVVVKNSDGELLTNVMIEIDGKQYLTDENGLARIEQLEAGNHDVVISKNGYDSITANVEVIASKTKQLNVTLLKTVTTGDLVINITDANNNPLLNASVEINGSTIESDAQGQVRLDALNAGVYTFTVTKEGYISETYTVTVQAKQEVVVSVKLEEISNTGDVVVNVVDESGNALSGVSIHIGEQVGTTNASGVASIEDILAGEYEVTISKDGYVSKMAVVEIEAGKITKINVALVKEIQQGSATVTVANKSGDPVHNASVVIRTENGDVVGEFTTDENGFVDVGNLNVGKYLINVSCDIDEGNGVGEMKAFEVVANKNTHIYVCLTDLETPETTGDFSIKVENLEGTRLPNAKVQLQNGTIVFGHTNDDGTIVFEDLAPGVYNVTVSADGYLDSTCEIEIVAGEVTEEIVTLHPVTTGNMNVVVKDEDGNLLSNATVTIDGVDYKTDENGNIIIKNLEKGSYNLIVTLTGYKNANASVTVVADETITHEIVLEKEIYTGTAAFTVTDKNNQPIVNATVTINGITLQTDEYGRAIFEELEVGDHEATISKHGYVSETIMFEIKPEKETLVEVSLKSSTGNLHLVVKDEDGNVLNNAAVRINGIDYTTDENGKVLISGLLPNTYLLNVSLDGYISSERNVVINADEVANLVVTLKKVVTTGNLRVVVNDENGNALSNATVQVGTQTVTTNEDGIAHLADIEAGEYEVTVTKDGYVAQSIITSIVAEQTTAEIVVLEKIVTTGTLSVVVKDEDGNLLSNATVTIDGTQYKTDEYGYVSLIGVKMGEHEVTVLADGYLEQSVVTVVSPKEHSTVNIVLQKAPTHGTVKFNIVDTNGSEIPTATVAVNGEWFITDENGKLTITKTFGDYDVEIMASDYVSKNINVSISHDDVVEITVVLERACGSAVVNVQTTYNKALAGATVHIKDENNNTYEVITDANGKVELPQIDAGVCRYTISLDGYNTDAGEFTVTHGVVTFVTVKMQPEITHSIAKFEVVDENGNTLNNVTVTVAGATGVTDANGIVSLNIPLYNPDGTPIENAYNYTAEKDGYVSATGTFSCGDTAITTVKVTMQEIVKTGNIQFVVKDNNGNAIENANVMISADGKGHMLTTDANGIANISNLPYGEYHVSVYKDGYVTYISNITLSEDAKEINAMLEKIAPPIVHGTATITVVDNNGDVVANAEVAIYGNDGNYQNVFYTDANGLVSATLEVGDYTVSVVKDGYVGDSAIILVEENAEAKTTLILEKVVVQETAMAEIYIKNQHGKDVLNASITIKDKNGNVVYEGKLNNQSSLYLQDLPAGEYTVTATKPNHKSNSASFTAVVGTSVIVDLVLVENLEIVDAGAIEIVVQNKNGEAIEGAFVTVLNEDGSIFGSYTTSRDGIITLSAMPIGNYTLYASHNGSDSKNVTTKVVSNQVSTVKLVIGTSSTGGDNSDNGGNNNPGGNDNVQTGDTNNIFLYGLMMVLSTIGLIFTRKSQKKNNSK